MWLVCDEIFLVWKINLEKDAWNQDKCAGMNDQELLVVVVMPVIVQAMSNKNLLKLLYCLGKLVFEMKEQMVEVMMVFE